MEPDPSNIRMLGAMLRIPFQDIVSRIDAGLKARGYIDLTPAHFVIFQHLDPGGSHITELAERAQITKQSIGSLIDHLEERGYVEKSTDPDDRRARIVRLTAKGKAVDRAARQILGQTEEEWAAKLGSDNIIELKRILSALIQIVVEREKATRP